MSQAKETPQANFRTGRDRGQALRTEDKQGRLLGVRSQRAVLPDGTD